MRLGINARFLAAAATGVQRFAWEVTRRLAVRPEVSIFLPRGAEWPESAGRGLRICRGRLSGPLWEQVELPRRTRSEQITVTLHPASSASLLGGPHVVVLHDVIALARPQDFTPAYRIWVDLAHVRAARRAAAVVTVSEWSADEIALRCRIPRERISVVPQAPAPLDAPATPTEVLAVRHKFDVRERYFMAVVGTDPRKGAAFLEQLWSEWSAVTSPPELILVGRKAGRVHRSPGDSPPLSRVRRLGSVSDDELRALYTGALGLLQPSASEGFGRPPLEALACGTRVVAAPYGPAHAVLGAAAELVELDTAAWRATLEDLVREPRAVREDRIARGRAWACRFDWDVAIERLWSVCLAAETRRSA